MNKIRNKDDLVRLRDTIRDKVSTYKYTAYVCGGAGCVSSHCDKVVEALNKAVLSGGLSKDVRVVVTGCIGLCAYGPCMIVEPDGVFYGNLTPEKVQAVVDRHLKGGQIAKEFCYYDEEKGDYIPHMKDIGFFSEQVRIALRNCGRVDFYSKEY
jgi:(2Fe-2S) ferredoxin